MKSFLLFLPVILVCIFPFMEAVQPNKGQKKGRDIVPAAPIVPVIPPKTSETRPLKTSQKKDPNLVAAKGRNLATAKGRNLVQPKGRNLVADGPTAATVEEVIISNIEKYAASVPIINFEGDVVLLQFPDRLSGKTDYRHLHPDLINQVVYERNVLDIDKDVIVLKSGEDHLEVSKDKRVYVVLRKNVMLTEKRLYYVAYLYLKDAAPNQKGVHEFGNRKFTVEWDFWDHRGFDETAGTQLEYIFPCSTTIFVPCRSNETIDYPQPGKLLDKANISESRSKYQPNVNKPFVLEGGKVDKYKEFFGDLDSVNGQGRSMKFNFQSMSDFGKPKKKRNHYMGQVFNFMDSDMKAFHAMINSVVEAGMGLIKHFNGLFGGIGTTEAKTDEVIKSLLGVEDPESLTSTLTKQEMEELDDEVKLPSSGGLGGMINADESREAEEEGIIQGTGRGARLTKGKGRNLDSLQQEDNLTYGTEVVLEGPYVKYGWKVETEQEAENSPFYGFGACRYRRVNYEDIEKATTSEELIHVYLTALRTQCITKDAKFYQQMFDHGLIYIDTDKSFHLNVSSPLLFQEKLQHKQRIELYRALEIFLFSQAYVAEMKHMTMKTIAPDNAPISRKIFTLGRAILNGLSMATAKMPRQHCVKLARNLVKTLKKVSIKLWEDNTIITPEDKEVNFNDRVYLMGLMQYMMHAITMEENDASKNFEVFYNKNKELLEDKVHVF